MKKFKKAALVALISPVIMVGCASTDSAEFEQQLTNKEIAVKSKLTPLNEFFKGNALTGCENKITLENFDTVLSERKSGIYGSPVSNDECVPLSFDLSEPESFYEDIISRAKSPDEAREIIETVKRSGYSDNLDDIHIQKIKLQDNTVAQLMRFPDAKALEKIESMWRNQDQVMVHVDEFIFLHELFHMASVNYDKSLKTNIREGASDISAVLSLSTKYELSLEYTKEFAKEVYHARRVEASDNPTGKAWEGSHFNPELLLGFIEHLEDLQNQGGDLKRFASLKEANNYSLDLIMGMPIEKRGHVIHGNVYWEKGMEVSGDVHQHTELANAHNHSERQSFSDILSIASSLKKPKETEPDSKKTHEHKEDDLELGF